MMDATPSKSWTPQEVLAIAFRHPAQFAPDAEYEYSNTNYALLGLVAEKVGDQPLAQQFQERLFGPLGLEQTSLPAADDTAIPAPYSHGYMYGGGFYALADDPYPADMQTAAKAGTLKPIDYTNQNSSYATAAGGAISTADDLATWMKALVSGRAFNADYHGEELAQSPVGRTSVSLKIGQRGRGSHGGELRRIQHMDTGQRQVRALRGRQRQSSAPTGARRARRARRIEGW
ncbi:MAG: Serine-type D-Ala-D-Ala carboxypeptidase [Mycobacterium sp.]|jgi:D-alanyl-D-alanine carboxypeptidase|nr:Serine-type D-Ala-D-Ala carboxypeptidase [Mycobacterium sp.]